MQLVRTIIEKPRILEERIVKFTFDRLWHDKAMMMLL